MTTSNHITAEEATNIIQAFAMAEVLNRPLNVSFCIYWKHVLELANKPMPAVLQMFVNRLTRTMKSITGESPYFVFINSNDSNKLQTRFLIHVDPNYIKPLLEELTSIVPYVQDNNNKSPISMTVNDNYTQGKAPQVVAKNLKAEGCRRYVIRKHLYDRQAILRFALRDLDPNAMAPLGTNEHKLRAVLEITKRGTFGQVPGARSGTSASLNAAARDQADWEMPTTALDMAGWTRTPDVEAEAA